MKTAANTDTGIVGGSGSPFDELRTPSPSRGGPTTVGREPNPPAFKSTLLAWLLAGASVAVIVVLYFFVFRAAHEVQIREVPLVTKGGRP